MVDVLITETVLSRKLDTYTLLLFGSAEATEAPVPTAIVPIRVSVVVLIV